MKKLLLVFTALALTLGLSACDMFGGGEDIDPEDVLTAITLSGIEDVEIEAETAFNALTGITAMGDDDVDYSEFISVDSEVCDIADDGTVDTDTAMTCVINYTVVAGGKLARGSMTLTITPKEIIIDDAPLLIGWDFEEEADLEGWSIYTANGGAIDMSIEDGAMKLITESGGQRFETRLDYQGLPLEQGYPYKVSFRAKSDIDGKKVHLNFGELLASDPWFTPFKPEGVDIITLSTEWQEFSFTFNMELNNQNGGPLFEMGDMEGSTGLDATIWIDDLMIEGGSGTDTLDPVFEGVEDTVLYIGDQTTYDVLAGITATDLTDGDLTADIVVGGDTLDINTAGTYVITYTVSDAAGNEATASRTIEVKEDTDAPVLTGVNDVTVIVGENFDPLAGVTAIDGRDGDVTDDIVLTGDTYEEVEGTYTLTYTVEDALGNSVTVDRVVEVLDLTFVDAGNLTNGTFDAGYWNAYWESWNGADAFFSTSDDGLVIDIKAVGGDFWHVLIEQPAGGITMEAGKTYRLTFDAMSSVARDIQVEVAGAGLTPAQETVSLTDTMTTYTVDFTSATATGGQLKFLMGLINGAGASVITIDNVMFEEFDGTDIVAETDQVMDGSFDEYQNIGWGVWSANDNTQYQVQWQEAWVTYEEANANPWENKLEQLGLDMIPGLYYRVTFDAKGDAARDFIVGFWDGGTAFEKMFELGTEYQTYTWIFKYTGGSTAALEFKLGQSSDNYEGTLFIVDNVSIEVEDAEPPAPLTLDTYPNQEFTDTDISGWTTEGTLTLSHDAMGYLVATVTELGANPWDQNIGFPGLNVYAGYTYTVSYTIKTAFAEGRDVTFFAEDTNNGYAKYFETTETLTDAFQTFTYTFTPTADNDDTKLGIFLGNTSNPLIGDVVIDSIIVTVEEAVVDPEPEWVDYGIGVTEDAGVATMTYADIPTPWYNANAQYTNFTFDGTYESIEFTFTGVDTHVYLFKIEGGGNARETEITADGTEQTVVISLSDLTKEERDALNLIIFFVKTEGSSGTATVAWNYPAASPEWVDYGIGVTEDAGVATMTYTAIPTPWYNANAQYTNFTFDGAKDMVEFTFTGVDTHVYLFKIEGGGNARETEITSDGTEQTVVIDLSDLTPEQRADLNLMVFFVKTEGASGTATVSFEFKTAPAWNAYGMTLTEDAGVATITYTSIPTPWYNVNAQYQNLEFDGTQDAIEFTFTGTDGHLYLFKIEGGGNATELEITADGTEQTLLIPLTQFTEAERAAFNLLIFFVKTEGVSGTATVTWDYAVAPTT